MRTSLLIDRLSKLFMNNNMAELTSLSQYSPARILVIAPHADDEVIGCGAAIDYFVTKGAEVCVLIVTTESDRSIAKTYHYTPEERIQESYLAKEILGYSELLYFNFPELKLRKDTVLQERFCGELSALIGSRNPDCIFIPNANEMHPDHQVIGRLSHHTILCGLQEKRFSDLAIMVVYEIWGPVLMNSYLEVTDTAYQKKVKSIQCYASQLSSVDYERIIRFIGGRRGHVLKEAGIYSGNKIDGMAEGYLLYHHHELLNSINHV